MESVLTTNGVRKMLEDAGAIRPSRRAVELVASKVETSGETSYWELMYLQYQIKQAVSAGASRTESEEAFRLALGNAGASQVASV
jgi:alkylhydroperoxidase/carboxymuconolactone decarboxylase family protein YurZ